MAKFNPADVLASYASIEALNSNFNRIAELFEQAVFRDGTPPNSMSTNFDMNHFNIQNVAPAVGLSDAVNYGQLLEAIAGETNLLDIENPALPAADRGVLAGMITTTLPATLQEPGREGLFMFDTADLSAEVTDDTLQGVYVAPSSDTTGASGAWRRIYSGPANVGWFGAALDDVTNDAAALQAALNVAKHVQIPANKTLFLGSGAINIPSDVFLHVAGNIRYDGVSQYIFRTLGNASNITILGPGTINSDLDLEFLTVFRFECAAGETIDNVRISGLTMNYTDTVHTDSGDRFFIIGNGAGTRSRFIIEDNVVNGWMQLTAAMASNGVFKDSEIRNNRSHNADSNAISISNTGGVHATNIGRAENIKIVGNTITADSSGATSTGIFVGIDGSSDDQQTELQDILIADNYINITDSPNASMDILIRIGNDVSNIGGILSTADAITLRNNRTYGSLQIDQPNVVTGVAQTRTTNFVAMGNIFHGGDLIFSHLADGATILGNKAQTAGLRPGPNNGIVTSSHNVWQTFVPNSSSSEFTWNSKHDEFLGRNIATDRVIQLTATTGKIQTLNLTSPTVNSISSSPFSGIRTNGLGTNTVTVRKLSTSTTWGFGVYEQTTGTITDYNRLTTYTPTLAATVNSSGLTVNRAVYERNENYVRVSANISGTATAGATSTRFTMTLPVASNFTVTYDCIGSAQSTTNAADNGGYVQGDTTNDVAEVGFIPTSSGAFTVNVIFQYQVK